MAEDISKNTIIILVVLTVVISLLGTWTVINEVNNIKTTNDGESTAGTQIKLTIEPPPVKITTTGQVVLTKTR